MLDSKKIKAKSVDSTLLPVGFVSRNQIIEMYGVSQASLTKYIRNNNFPIITLFKIFVSCIDTRYNFNYD